MPQNPQVEYAVCVDGVQKRYNPGALALKGVSFNVKRGEFFGLLGPNGAGKTTLISCLCGLTTPTAGRLTVMGHDVTRERRQSALNLGVVPQEITFDIFLRVRETLELQSGFWGVRNNRAWIDTILSRLGLADLAEREVYTLSGGMKRRVLVAQALVHKPEVIVLDEPTAGVDVALREELWSFIGDLHSEGHTIILTTHYIEEAQALCDRVAIMNAGSLVALDRTEKLLEQFHGRVMRCRLQGGDLPGVLRDRVLREHGNDVSLRIGDANDVLFILNTLKTAGIAVDNLTVDQPSLEEVFLQLTGA